MSLLKVNEIQIFNGETVTITAPTVVTANDNSNAALRITQTGSGNALVVEDSANPDSTPFVVDNAGKVGIGTTSPTTNLHLIGIQKIQTRTDIFNGNYTLSYQSATNTVDYGSVWRHHQGDDESSDAGIMLGGSGAYEGRMVFETAGTERMRIDSSGNVGIGTSSPSQKLDVTGNINATGALTLGTALAVAEGGTGVTSLGSLDAADLGSGAATDGYVLTADGAGGAAWEAASGGGGGTTAYVEHSSTISDSFTVTSGNNRMYIGGTTFSGTISVAGRLVIVGGEANFTGTINTTGVLAILGVP